MTALRVWLVRHGETEWNVQRRLTGWTDVGLTDRGRSQAEVLADRLRGVRFAGVWSSDLRRTVETARIAWGEPTVDSRLREIDFGELEGMVWEEFPAERRRTLSGFDGFAAPGGESVEQLRERVTAFLDTLPPGDHLVVTHGGVVRLLARECGADGFPANAELLVLDWGGRAVLDVEDLF